MISKYALKPCPFCGGVAMLDFTREGKPFVRCLWGWQFKPMCKGYDAFRKPYATVEEAIEDWNERG